MKKSELEKENENLKKLCQYLIYKLSITSNNSKINNIDMLTNFYNRNSYELFKTSIKNTKGITLVIFDLFRLKYVNDNYNHDMGDKYIKCASQIISNYFPIHNDNNYFQNIFRFGGDEFILVTNFEEYDEIIRKCNFIQEDMANLKLEVDTPLMINYGASNIGNNILDMQNNAEERLKRDKDKFYKEYKLDRRK